MAGFLDSKARATALKLLKKFGKLGTYEHSESTYDPITEETVTNTNSVDITCFIDSSAKGELMKSGLATGTDSVVLVSASELGIDVVANDTIEFADGTKLSIKSNDPLYSGELIAMHRIICENR